MKDSDWMLREAGWHRLVMDAYNEGFMEGMREHTSHKGGQPWSGSKAQKKMNELARTPQEPETHNG
jgi:hypothetical protein